VLERPGRLVPLLRSLLLILIGSSWRPEAALGWSSLEHRRLTAAALELLAGTDAAVSPERVAVVVDASVQPDLMRPRELPLLREAEAPRHYIDLELLVGSDLPATLSGFLRMVDRLAVGGNSPLSPDWSLESVGILPYALAESVERLSAIYAQLRHRPTDPTLVMVALYQAGIVAHYAQDLCQPLHTTVHHDGRARDDFSSPQSGIHRQVDGLLRWIPDPPIEGPVPRVDGLLESVIAQVEQSHSQVDRVYDLAVDLQILWRKETISPELATFARERYERAVTFTATLISYAWQRSAAVTLPSWTTEPSSIH
jgi:hypothetical protein